MGPILGNRGFSLIEVMISLGIVGIAVVGSLSAQKVIQQVQRQNQVSQVAQQLKNKFYNTIMDPDSWKTTVNNNPNMACVRDKTSCAALIGTPQNFDLYNAGRDANGLPTVFYRTLVADNSDGAGFSEMNAAACNDFRQAGNTNCSIGYRMTWEPECLGNCINPSIRINVRMLYRPSPNDPAPPLNTEKFSLNNFSRAPAGISKSFSLYHEPAPSTPNAGGGACATGGAWTRRPLEIKNAEDNPYNLVSVNVPARTFSLNQRGTYRCNATALGFAVNSFRILIRELDNPDRADVNTGGGTGRAEEMGSNWLQGTATMQVFIRVLNVPANFEFVQTCEQSKGDYDLGLPSAYYIKSVYASLNCTLVD